MTRFDALEVALEIVKSLRGLLPRLERKDRELALQIRKAGVSIPANVAEGNRRVGKDRTYHFRVAAGSADEVRAELRVALAWGYVDEPELEEPLGLIDRELAMLYRLTHR